MRNILITGVSSGLGEALVAKCLDNNDRVYAIGRTLPQKFASHPHFFFMPYDLSETFLLQASLEKFIISRAFDLVLLNAGILGEIAPLNETTLPKLHEIMEVNVWANKELIDLLATKAQFVKQIVGISSGAAVNGSKGWGGYSLSKAALNMLLKVYAKELPEIHFTALAPGVIKTPMTDHIVQEVDATRFPSAQRLKEGHIQSPKEAAQNLLAIFPKLLTYESGSFLDIRTMED